jgi:hypothetical protein
VLNFIIGVVSHAIGKASRECEIPDFAIEAVVEFSDLPDVASQRQSDSCRCVGRKFSGVFGTCESCVRWAVAWEGSIAKRPAGGGRKWTNAVALIVKAAVPGARRIAGTCVLARMAGRRIQGDLGKNEKRIQHEVGVQFVFVRPGN